jgi:hypothetical protein
LHGVVKFNKAPRDRNKNVKFLMTWRLHGALAAIMAILRSFRGVLIGDYLRSDCASTAVFAFPLRIYCADMAVPGVIDFLYMYIVNT